MGHTLTLAGDEAIPIVDNAGGSSGQGDLVEMLAKTPLAQTELKKIQARATFDGSHPSYAVRRDGFLPMDR